MPRPATARAASQASEETTLDMSSLLPTARALVLKLVDQLRAETHRADAAEARAATAARERDDAAAALKDTVEAMAALRTTFDAVHRTLQQAQEIAQTCIAAPEASPAERASCASSGSESINVDAVTQSRCDALVEAGDAPDQSTALTMLVEAGSAALAARRRERCASAVVSSGGG